MLGADYQSVDSFNKEFNTPKTVSNIASKQHFLITHPHIYNYVMTGERKTKPQTPNQKATKARNKTELCLETTERNLMTSIERSKVEGDR